MYRFTQEPEVYLDNSGEEERSAGWVTGLQKAGVEHNLSVTLFFPVHVAFWLFAYVDQLGQCASFPHSSY